MTSLMRTKMAKAVQYQRLGKGRVIFSEGDPADRYYIIFSGSVSVSRMEKSVAFSMKSVQGRSDGQHGQHEIVVATLYAGEAFGDLALDGNLGGKRSAGVKTLEFTELLFLDSDKYRLIVRSQREEEILTRLRLLQNMPLFFGSSATTSRALSTMASLLVARKFPSGTAIVQQGEEDDQLYFLTLTSGDIRVIREVHVPRVIGDMKRNDPGMWNSLRGQIPVEELKQNVTSRRTLPLEVNHLERYGHFLRNKLDHGAKTSCATLVTNTETEVYFLNRWDFYRCLSELQAEMDSSGEPDKDDFGLNVADTLAQLESERQLFRMVLNEVQDYENDASHLNKWADGVHWEKYKNSMVSQIISGKSNRTWKYGDRDFDKQGAMAKPQSSRYERVSEHWAKGVPEPCTLSGQGYIIRLLSETKGSRDVQDAVNGRRKPPRGRLKKGRPPA